MSSRRPHAPHAFPACGRLSALLRPGTTLRSVPFLVRPFAGAFGRRPLCDAHVRSAPRAVAVVLPPVVLYAHAGLRLR